MRALLLTPRGSRLYGLHRENSDYDYFVVTEDTSRNPYKQTKYKNSNHYIVGDLDVVSMGLGTFSLQVYSGTPEALEAAFSPAAEIDLLSAYRAQIRVGYGAQERYISTMKSFALSDTYKSKRHALRLALNLRDMKKHGRFNPALKSQEIVFVNKYSLFTGIEVYKLSLKLALG